MGSLLKPDHIRTIAAVLSAITLISGCGGGGSSDSSSPPTGTITAQKCSVQNPYRFDVTTSTTSGTITDEKAWLHRYFVDSYLWYNEIPNIDSTLGIYSDESTADAYLASMDRYFDAHRTPLKTTSGKDKDQFSFLYSTKKWRELIQSGSSLGYGIEWRFEGSGASRVIRIAYLEPSSPATSAGLQRGDTLISADGAAANATAGNEYNTLIAALFPSSTSNHSLQFNRGGSLLPLSVLTPTNVIKQPVLVNKVLDVGDAKVGYMLFNDHVAIAEQQLINGMNQFKDAGVSDLILDLRYNGGGYIYLASQVAQMIAGSAKTSGKIFEKLQYNDKRNAETNSSQFSFWTTSCFLSGGVCTNQSITLPTLNLSRVFIIATSATCSASEAIINGLEGIDIEVKIVGSTSCGKPYGFSGKNNENCGVSFFPIEFKGTNNKGFGDYADGFVAGCAASDDLSKSLGDETEGMLAKTLSWRANGTCPTSTKWQKPDAENEPYLMREKSRENQFAM